MDNNIFTFNGVPVAFHREIDPDGVDLIVQFNKNDNRDVRNITQAIRAGMVITRPDCTAFEFMVELTRTGSEERGFSAGFWDSAEKKQGSNSFLRRMIDEGGIRFNGRILKQKDKLDFPIFSIVAFPKSQLHYTTVF